MQYQRTSKVLNKTRLAVSRELKPMPANDFLMSYPPVKSWVNVKKLGAAGDNETDDAEIIQKALNDHKVVYFPNGNYIVLKSINLNHHDDELLGYSVWYNNELWH